MKRAVFEAEAFCDVRVAFEMRPGAGGGGGAPGACCHDLTHTASQIVTYLRTCRAGSCCEKCKQKSPSLL